ncbi:MAG: thioredoxin family protein [Deltaproteobacteria bacterium]|nr:MAG: thioredoxin family protein [Deltaproteobacteria bacterium]
MAQKGTEGLLSVPEENPIDVVSVRTAWSVDYARPGDQVALAVVFNIKDGYHINADTNQIVSSDNFKPYSTRVTVKNAPEELTIESPRFPPAQAFEVDYASGNLMSFAGQTTVYLPMKLAEQAKAGTIELIIEVAYQACSEKLCYFPKKVTLNEKLRVVKTDAIPAKINLEFFYNYEAAASEASGVVSFDLFGWYFSFNVSSRTGLTILWLTAAFGGMLLNFTPCVLPLIPIKIISLSNSAENRQRCLALGVTMFFGVLVFWVGLGATIATVSEFTATSQLFQYPVFTIGIGVIIAIMAFGMCGLFSVRLPEFIYLINPNQETLPGSFGLGVLTAILSTPCTAPFMGAAAVWATSQQPAITLSTFAVIGTGMALPYLMLSAFPALIQKMPKTGPASILIKEVMGLFMLAAAAYFIGGGLSALLNTPPNPPNQLYWWVVMGFSATAGGWLVYRTFRITKKRKLQFFFASLGLIILVGSAYGGLQLTDKGPIEWVYYTPGRFKEAIDSRKIVVTVFTAEWCLNCKALEQGVLNKDKVTKLFAEDDVVPIKVDITGKNPAGKERLKKIGHLTIPLLVIYAPGGKEIFRGDFYTADQIYQVIENARKQSLYQK